MAKHNTDHASGIDPIDTSPTDGKSARVSERLKSLASGELSEDVIQEIRVLLAERLPEEACQGQDEIAQIRANLWSAMLLGLRPEDINSQHELVCNSLHGGTSEADHAEGLMHFPKEDQRVLAADIKRTRQAYAMFKRDDVMVVLSHVLERYCVGHGIRYKQGQNELVAPFVMLQDPPLPVPVLGLLFESFMSRFVSRWFVDDEIESLLVSYRIFRVLLFYLDPGLASKLDDADFVPELYATAWLITLFSRNLSMDLVMRLWDVYLAVNDPSLVFFLLAALLVRNRDVIMKVEQAHMMPEMIQGLTIENKQDLEELIFQAREMSKKIPESFLRTVRSCCSDHGNIPLDTSRSLFCESVRCVSIEPRELLDRMSGKASGPPYDEHQEGNEEGNGAKGGRGDSSPCPMRPGPVDTVALDIRPLNEFENNGVGHLGKSLRLDPCLLKMNEILEKWMQHFDGTRGTHVCLIDSVVPATTCSSMKKAGNGKSSINGSSGNGREETNSGIVEDPLWRRLLFGEGEGSASWDEDWVNVTEKRGGGRGGEAMTGACGKMEDSMPEGFSAAKAFAEKLHARGFPYVSILEGGMEALVEHLHQSESPLEPTVINHRSEAYAAWRRRTRALRDKQEAETVQSAVFTRAGKAYSWGKGKGNVGSSTALQKEYSSLPLDTMAVTQKGVVGGEAADAGGGPSVVHPWKRSTASVSGHEKVGFMDRLGLMSLKGVTQGVGTVAHGVGAVAHGVTQGVTQGVGTVARSGARAVMGGAEMLVSSAGGLTAPDEDFEVNGGFTVGGQQRESFEDGVTIWEVEDGSEGKESFVGAIRGTGRAVVSGVGTVHRSEPLQQESRHSNISDNDDSPGLGETLNAFDGGQEKSEEMLLKALNTAEANGHTAIARAIRARLGVSQRRALRRKVGDEKRNHTVDPSTRAGNKEVLESLADLA